MSKDSEPSANKDSAPVAASEKDGTDENAEVNSSESEPKTLLKSLVQAAEQKPWIAWPALVLAGLLAIGGGVEAIGKILGGFRALASEPSAVSVVAISGREEVQGNKPPGMTDEELELNGVHSDPQHWETFVDITLQNNSAFPVVILRSEVTIQEKWLLMPTGRLLGLLEPTGTFDVTLPADGDSTRVTVAGMNFGLAPKTSEVLALRIRTDNANRPCVFLLNVTLTYATNGGEESTKTDNVIAFVQGAAEYVQVFGGIQRDTPRDLIVESMSYVTESMNEVFLNASSNAEAFSAIANKQVELTGKLVEASDFNSKLLTVFTPVFESNAEFDVERQQFQEPDGTAGEPVWRVYEHGDISRNYPLITITKGQTDEYASGWSFDELEGELLKKKTVITVGESELLTVVKK